jgi:hypothetical protein
MGSSSKARNGERSSLDLWCAKTSGTIWSVRAHPQKLLAIIMGCADKLSFLMNQTSVVRLVRKAERQMTQEHRVSPEST